MIDLGRFPADLFPFVFAWGTVKRGAHLERKGTRCRVVARGGKGTIEVEFVDGSRMFTARYAVRNVEHCATL